jgi:glycosyltransferase involved in cell wall biosynthesis
MRDLPGGAEWQDGAMGIPVRRGDVLVVTGAPRCLSTLGLIAKARLRGARVLWWGHYWSATTRPWRHNLRLQIMRLADAQVLYTDAELAEYRDKLGRDPGPNVSALNNGIDTDPIARHRAPYAAAARERAVFFVGRLEAKAQLDLLLRALARPESGGLALHVLGDGTEGESLRALAGELGLEDRVHWHGGSTDEARISAVANRCRLFCYPGGVGLSLIHAMAYGLPAVVHSDRWTHMPEIAAFRDGVTGESFPPGDEGALARVLGGLADDLPALDAMSRAALATTEASFNTADMARRFALAIRRLRESPA